MRNKITFIILLVLFASFVSAECPPDCPPDQQQQAYTYDQFQQDYATDPALAAQNYPDYYMRRIGENPEEVANNPQAYENAVSHDVKYINQNKNAFKSYAQTKGITFSSIDGDFKSFDVGTGTIETKGIAGQKVATFSLEHVQVLESLYSGSNFRISKEGELVFDQPFLASKRAVATEGIFKMEGGDLIITNGKYIVEGKHIAIEITGNNRGKFIPRLLAQCSSTDVDHCGFIEVESISSPVKLSQGVLTKGKALIVSSSDVDLQPNAEYLNEYGTKFSGTKQTRITLVVNGCLSVSHSCVEESNPFYEGVGEQEKLVSSGITIHARDGNNLKVEAKDGFYKKVIVKQITENEPRVLVGTFGGKEVYITKKGAYVRADGSWERDISKYVKEIQEHPNYATAKEQAGKIPDEATKVDLVLTKSDNSKARIVFSKDKPISQGKLAGLQTNIGHVFEVEGTRYPWLVYNGKPSPTTKGKLDEEWLSLSVAKLITEKRREEVSLALEAVDSLSRFEAQTIIRYSPTADSTALETILNKYEPDEEDYKTRDAKIAEKIGLLSKFSIDSPAAVELQKKMLAEIGTVADDTLISLLYATSGREELQKEVLHKTEEIHDPGNALANVKSNELRKIIIEKTKSVDVRYAGFPGEGGNPFPLQHYLMELKKLDPELQKLALDNLDFKSGVFVHSYYKGEALRRTIEFYKDDPEKMNALLERMPMRKDMGFNPEGFRTVFFNKDFQEKTKGLDFANKYSIAYTAQRYLDQRGTWLPNDRTEAISLIIQQRERFANQVILDENTYYIPLTHEEERFENNRMVQLARDSGVKEIADQNLKGAGAKDTFLKTIEESGDKGKTTVHFSGHGGPNHQWLSKGQAGVETSDELRRPEAISYVEFGDALATRGNLGEVTVMIDSCYSKDFTDNLYHYLSSVKGVTNMPTVITETNRRQVGFDSFIEAVESSHEKGKPLTGSDIFGAESRTFFQQDLTVTMPVTSGEGAKFSKPETPGVVDLGSPTDDGAAEPPQKPKGEPSEEKPAELPSTVIEIAQNEQEMEELLATG
ncbi:MAG: hypothetical protein AB1668_04965 [Nanoarchaeota archaeon]